MTYTPKIASFFSGAGLMDIGLIDSGCEITPRRMYWKTCLECHKDGTGRSYLAAAIHLNLTNGLEGGGEPDPGFIFNT